MTGAWGDPEDLIADREQELHERAAGPSAPSSPITDAIGDNELLRRAVHHAIRRRGKSRSQMNWVSIMETFALGSTATHELCHRFGVDPDGKGLPGGAS
jgi:hypothetical protein